MFDSIMEAIFLFQKRESNIEEMPFCLENLRFPDLQNKQISKWTKQNKTKQKNPQTTTTKNHSESL